MTDERKRSSGRSLVAAAVAVAVLLVAYPLSYGPAIRLCYLCRIPIAVVITIYQPLDVAVNHSPIALQEAYSAYVDWWMADVFPTVLPPSTLSSGPGIWELPVD